MNANSGKNTAFRTAIIFVILCLVETGAYLWHISHRPQLRNKPSIVAVGVGMYLKRDKETHKLVITKIFPNSPAEKAGLVPGLVLNKINNALAETNGIKKISALLMGPIGSKVVLEIIDSNDVTNHLEVTREQFVNHSTR